MYTRVRVWVQFNQHEFSKIEIYSSKVTKKYKGLNTWCVKIVQARLLKDDQSVTSG